MQETKLTVFSTQECTKRAHEAGPQNFHPRIQSFGRFFLLENTRYRMGFASRIIEVFPRWRIFAKPRDIYRGFENAR